MTLPGPPYGSRYFPVLDTDTPTGEPADPRRCRSAYPIVIPGRTVWLLRADRTRAALTDSPARTSGRLVADRCPPPGAPSRRRAQRELRRW